MQKYLLGPWLPSLVGSCGRVLHGWSSYVCCLRTYGGIVASTRKAGKDSSQHVCLYSQENTMGIPESHSERSLFSNLPITLVPGQPVVQHVALPSLLSTPGRSSQCPALPLAWGAHLLSPTFLWVLFQPCPCVLLLGIWL